MSHKVKPVAGNRARLFEDGANGLPGKIDSSLASFISCLSFVAMETWDWRGLWTNGKLRFVTSVLISRSIQDQGKGRRGVHRVLASD